MFGLCEIFLLLVPTVCLKLYWYGMHSMKLLVKAGIVVTGSTDTLMMYCQQIYLYYSGLFCDPLFYKISLQEIMIIIIIILSYS